MGRADNRNTNTTEPTPFGQPGRCLMVHQSAKGAGDGPCLPRSPGAVTGVAVSPVVDGSTGTSPACDLSQCTTRAT